MTLPLLDVVRFTTIWSYKQRNLILRRQMYVYTFEQGRNIRRMNAIDANRYQFIAFVSFNFVPNGRHSIREILSVSQMWTILTDFEKVIEVSLDLIQNSEKWNFAVLTHLTLERNPKLYFRILVTDEVNKHFCLDLW